MSDREIRQPYPVLPGRIPVINHSLAATFFKDPELYITAIFIAGLIKQIPGGSICRGIITSEKQIHSRETGTLRCRHGIPGNAGHPSGAINQFVAGRVTVAYAVASAIRTCFRLTDSVPSLCSADKPLSQSPPSRNH